MSARSIRLAAVAAVLMVAGSGLSSARKFFHSPTPFGYGYNHGGSTVLGDQARGFGHFAAGVGEFNLRTAQARAINTQTNLILDQAARNAQIQRNIEHRRLLALQQARLTHHRAVTDHRLRFAPLAHDLSSGDALNVLLADLSRPDVYLASLQSSERPIPSSLVRSIPLMHAPGGISISLKQLAQAPPPAAFRFGVINQNPARFIAFRQELNRSHSIEVGELVTFLRRFDLRFGPAVTSEQREAYRTLYPILLELSDEAHPQAARIPLTARR